MRRTEEQSANLSVLRGILAKLPGDQYNHLSMGDGITAHNVFTTNPRTDWKGPGCALSHAHRSGLFPGLVNSLQGLYSDREVFGNEASNLLFASDRVEDGIMPARGEDARRKALHIIDKMLDADGYMVSIAA